MVADLQNRLFAHSAGFYGPPPPAPSVFLYCSCADATDEKRPYPLTPYFLRKQLLPSIERSHPRKRSVDRRFSCRGTARPVQKCTRLRSTHTDYSVVSFGQRCPAPPVGPHTHFAQPCTKRVGFPRPTQNTLIRVRHLNRRLIFDTGSLLRQPHSLRGYSDSS